MERKYLTQDSPSMMRLRDHIPELDGLRALAVLAVMYAHVDRQLVWLPQPTGGPWGAVAVHVFFALSGFLITRILLFNREHGIGLADFWRRRIARIFPPAYLCLLACLVFWPSRMILHAALYYLNFMEPWYQLYPTPLGHFWSLCVEEQFYLLWPLVVMLLPVAVSRRVAWYALALVPLAGLVVVKLVAEANEDALFLPLDRVAHFWLLPAGWTLLVGCLAAYYEATLRQSRWLLPALAAAAFVASWSLYRWQGHFLFSLHEIPAFGQFSVRFMGAGVFLLATWQPFAERFTLLRDPSLRWVGQISYGLYVYHVPVYRAFGVDSRSEASPLDDWPVVTAILCTFVIASASYYWVELPIMRWAKSRRPHLSASPAPPRAPVRA